MTWPTSWSPRPWEEGLDSFAVTGFVHSYRKAPNRHENPVPTDVLHDLALTDDEAAAALNRAATVDGVRAALGRIQASGDATMFIVITYMLDHIQRTGEQPSSRQAGAACWLSHTAVADALVRMRPDFEVVRQTARDS